MLSWLPNVLLAYIKLHAHTAYQLIGVRTFRLTECSQTACTLVAKMHTPIRIYKHSVSLWLIHSWYCLTSKFLQIWWMWNDGSLMFEFVFPRVCIRVNTFICVYWPMCFHWLFLVFAYFLLVVCCFPRNSLYIHIYVDIWSYILDYMYFVDYTHFKYFFLAYSILGEWEKRRRGREKLLVSLFLIRTLIPS